MNGIYRWSYFKGAKAKLDENGKGLIKFNAYRDKVKIQEGSFKVLCGVLAEKHSVTQYYPDGKIVDRKEGKCTLPGISGAYYDTAKRGNEFVVGNDLLIFDIDSKGKPMPIDVLNILIAACPYKVAHYFSYSHTDQILNPEGLLKCRLVIPLSRGVRPDLWREFVTWACTHLGFDPWLECLDLGSMRKVAQIYFLRGNWDNNPMKLVAKDGLDLEVPPNEELETIYVPTLPGEIQGTSMGPQEFKAFVRHYNIDFKTLDLTRVLRHKDIQVGPEQRVTNGTKHRCHCPWAHEHSGGRDDDGAWITMVDGKWPRFRCAHSGCADKQLADVLEWAGAEVVTLFADPYSPGPSLPINPLDGNLSFVISPQAPEGQAAVNEDGVTPDQRLKRLRNAIRPRLVQNENGQPKAAGGNLVTIMQMDPWFQDQFSINEMSTELLWNSMPMEAYHMSRIQQMLLYDYGVNFPISSIEYECRSQGERRLFNPVKDYFSGLKWDGVSRFQQVLTDVLHVEASELHLSYLKKLMTAVVMRTFIPGEKFDSILVLVSKQGKSKGRFYEVLGGDWYGSPDPSVINSTDAKMAFHMSIINEIQEVDKMTGKTDARNLKSLLSTREDIFRVPYGRKPQVHRRKFVLVGSANESEGLLVDHTGHRRWWVIRLPDDQDIDVDLLKTIKDQLWAEAVELYRAGYTVYLDKDLDEQRECANSPYEAYDPYMDLILAHLSEIETTLKWNARNGIEGISMLDVMTHMQIPDSLKVNGAQSVMRMVGPILVKMGWTKKQYSEVDATSGRRIGPWRWSPPNLREIIDRKDRYPVVVPNLNPLPPLPGATSAN